MMITYILLHYNNIFRVLCQNLNDHNAVEKQTEAMINTCLNQTKYKKYISEVEPEPFDCKNSSINCWVVFLVYPKSYHILEYDEMLIVDKISLLGNLGGLLGLFVGFSVFGYASILVDLILEKIKPRVVSLIPVLRPSLGVPSNGSGNNGMNASGNGNASNPVGVTQDSARPASRGSSGDSWSIIIRT